MILKSVRVQNFRAVRDAHVDFGAHTAILGGNGAGKSTILKAIERFYAPSTTVEGDDFWGRHLDQPIRISLTFTDFNTDEMERFGERIESQEMTVTRVFEAGGGRNNGRYFGTTRQYPPFAEIRGLQGAVERRQRFNSIAGDLGLQQARTVGEVDDRMAAWEAEHPEGCEQRTDDGQFFGFTNVARGNLQKSTSFVFIPAVRDASADSIDARGAVIARLMELVVRSAVQRRADVRNFQQRVTNEYRELVDPARLPELEGLAGGLSGTLRDYYADATVALRWRPPEDFAIPLPTAEVMLEEDGFEGPVDRKGHGLQRAFIVTLLQHLAKAGSADANLPIPIEQLEREQPEGLADSEPYVLPGLILAIEEPELYQHPTKQRHFARVLHRLSNGSLPGLATRTQVMFASHSPLFVSLDRFDEVRLARRHAPQAGAERECRLRNSTLDKVAARLEVANAVAPGTYSGEGLRSRLHIVGAELAEGFFADAVVLVEGVSDRAALFAAATVEGADLEAAGIAVLVADGKSKMDRPAAIFIELGIPTYVVFDCDAGSEEEVAANRALQRLMGEEHVVDCASRVTANYACFEHKLERQLRHDLTPDVFNAQLRMVQEAHHIRRDDVLKTPSAMTDALQSAALLGYRSRMLKSILDAVLEMRAV